MVKKRHQVQQHGSIAKDKSKNLPYSPNKNKAGKNDCSKINNFNVCTPLRYVKSILFNHVLLLLSFVLLILLSLL